MNAKYGWNRGDECWVILNDTPTKAIIVEPSISDSSHYIIAFPATRFGPQREVAWCVYLLYRTELDAYGIIIRHDYKSLLSGEGVKRLLALAELGAKAEKAGWTGEVQWKKWGEFEPSTTGKWLWASEVTDSLGTAAELLQDNRGRWFVKFDNGPLQIATDLGGYFTQHTEKENTMSDVI